MATDAWEVGVMTNHVTCRCGQRFAAAAPLNGKTVPCPACGAPLSIPHPARAQFHLSLHSNTDPSPLWRGSLAAGASYVVTGGTSDDNLRQAMFAELLKSIEKSELPYYLPRDGEAIPLPLVIEP